MRNTPIGVVLSEWSPEYDLPVYIACGSLGNSELVEQPPLRIRRAANHDMQPHLEQR